MKAEKPNDDGQLRSRLQETPIAVIGMACLFPEARNVREFWDNVVNKRNSITDVPSSRWDVADYYDPDPKAPDKTYCKIGGWVREYEFEPFQWRIPIPPKVQAVMDDAQKWAVASCRAALLDYGYPDRALNTSRTAVVLGNAMAGEYHYRTSLRIYYPEYAHALESVPAFKDLPPDVRAALIEGMGGEIRSRISDITEDTMPGELSNIIAGRVANALNLHGLNFVTDAACASSFAALNAAVEGLVSGHFDAVLTGVSGRSALRGALESLDTREQVLLMGHAVPMPIVIRTRKYDEEFYRAVGAGERSVAQDWADLFGK